jgi:hypothetical protein
MAEAASSTGVRADRRHFKASAEQFAGFPPQAVGRDDRMSIAGIAPGSPLARAVAPLDLLLV